MLRVSTGGKVGLGCRCWERLQGKRVVSTRHPIACLARPGGMLTFEDGSNVVVVDIIMLLKFSIIHKKVFFIES